jgi:hypothetical protein
MNLISYLEKFDIPTVSVTQAVQAVSDLSEDDASLFNSLFDFSYPDNPVLAAKYIANAVVKGENDPAKVRAYVQARLNTAAQAVVKEVPALIVAPTVEAVETAPETSQEVTEAVSETVTEPNTSTVEAAQEASTEASVEFIAKPRRGRPKLAETAYDRAVKVLNDLGKYDTKSMVAALTATGVPKNSAHVYICKARGDGLIPRA